MDFHLLKQKCRSGTCNYAADEDHDPSYNGTPQSETPGTRARRFGIMPRIIDHPEHTSNVQENAANYMVEDPPINSNVQVQQNMADNLVQEPIDHLPMENDIQENSQVQTNRPGSVGHIPFGNAELGAMGDGDLSIYDMMIPDDLTMLDAQGGMNKNNFQDEEINWAELLKDLNLEDEPLPDQVSFF